MKKSVKIGVSLSKYVLLACIILFVVIIFHNTEDSRKSFETVEKELRRTLDSEFLEDCGSQELKRYYSLNSENYAGIMLLTAEESMSAEEILLIKVKEQSQLEEIEAAVYKRLESRINDFGSYAPEQTALLEAAEVTMRGDYFFLAVSEYAEEYKEAFIKSLF